MNAQVGNNIRTIREIKGLSQEDMAEKLHISRSTYNGETNSWVNHLEKLCES